MIPKKIHYCWFGGNPLPAIAIKCIASWKKHCPDYEIIQWDESNCDLDINIFVKQAYENKKWAFVSDYFRLKIVEEHGGIYLDVDVELLKPLDNLLHLDGFMGFELGDYNINTGLGFGAVAKNPVIIKLRENYDKSTFIRDDGSLDTTPCPQRDSKVLVELGLVKNNKKQTIQGITFFPADYFSPTGFLGEEYYSENTYSVHHFNASWHTEKEQKAIETRKKLRKKFGNKMGELFFLFYLSFRELKENGVRGLLLKIKKRNT